MAVLACLAAPAVMAAGDPVRGKQLSTTCFACHGEDGNSPSPVNPRIGGQHASYILLAMQAYLDGTRKNSLMSGALLNKTPQELEDIAAYFASQNAALNSAPAAPGGSGPSGPGGPRGPGGRGGAGGVVKFDHGARAAEFSALLARARAENAAGQSVGEEVCTGFGSGMADGDGDGLADRFDAAPGDNNEFAADVNADGRYEICFAEQLQAIVTLNSAGLTEAARKQRHYQLVRDVDAAAIENFEPLGNCGPTGNCMRALGEFGFAGVFDGQGHAVKNVRINYPERGGVGLFGVLAESGVILNLRVKAINVVGRAGTGAIVGSNFGVIYRSGAAGRVDAAMAVGGLVGGSAGLLFATSFDGEVTGGQAIGGLVGDMTGAVYASHSRAAVVGQRGIGGLVGLNTFGAIHDSHASGPVTGTNDVGGLVGVNTDARVRNSYATGKVAADGNNVGGLVGFNSLSTVRNAFATNAVNGADAVGGLVGRNNGVVSRAFATGPVAADVVRGDVVGIEVEGSATGTFPTAEVPAAALAGLTGEATGWAPASLPVKQLLDYFCDANGNGFIDPAERNAGNYVWNFSAAQPPTLRCESQIVGPQ